MRFYLSWVAQGARYLQEVGTFNVFHVLRLITSQGIYPVVVRGYK